MALTDKLTAIGNAIRNKTGTTSRLTLAQMVTKINSLYGPDANLIASNIKSGVSIFGVNGSYYQVEINGQYYNGTLLRLKNFRTWIPFSEANFSSGGILVALNNELHYIQGVSHYKFNGSSWISASTLPSFFSYGSCVVLNNEIHILFGENHYKFNGSSWVSVGWLPHRFSSGSAVVLNNEIHILGGTNSPYKHYKFNGSSWTSVSSLPLDFAYNPAIVFNNEIHLLGTIYPGYYTKHYKFNGSTWLDIGTIPSSSTNNRAIIYDNCIYLFDASDGRNYYKFNGSTWTLVGSTIYPISSCSLCVLNNEINMVSLDNNVMKHSKFCDLYTEVI